MQNVTIRACGENTVTLPAGVTVAEALNACEARADAMPVIAAFVNNEVRALSYRLAINAEIRPIFINTGVGQRVYRRSVCYALAIAAHKTLPGRRLLIGHSLGNAYYYSLDGRAVDPEIIQTLGKTLSEIVAGDLAIRRGVVAYTDALEYFNARGMRDAALLVERHNYSEVPVYHCDDFMDLSYGPLAPSTGILTAWEIEPYDNGFLLVFPTASDHTKVSPGYRSTTLFQIYREYKEWGRVLGISSVGQLNHLTERKEVKAFIRVNEALHEKKIARIADQVTAAGETEKVVLVAGPSSSGKTTFTKKLGVQLRVVGLIPIMISLDDYFVPRELTPLDEDGKYDFENIGAIDVDLLNDHLVRLFKGEEVELPSFDFKTGAREYRGNVITLPDRGVLLMEGIHGLNDALTPRVDADRKFKVYVSALTQLNLDDHNRISTTDNRLIRRMVRDHQFRGHSAVATLEMWPSVRRGEDQNIFPFQDSADAAFNTALDYELGVLRNYAEPLLRQVKPWDDVYHEAVRLQTFLRNFSTIPEKNVPSESILREFIGDSGFHY
ncbi:MAG: nucleoside kinase [Spirochaeta sp.]|jgi:uridine kinase|nr:nucleoside kinase [Spirochaeta sp.]